ncbi:MAG TPA: hypothetical protein VGM26_07705 [Rhizomicrobium sp.]|jgi:hypothetical protein
MARQTFTPVAPEIFGDNRFAEERILDANGVLEIALEEEGGRRLTVSFNAYLAFRKMDEGDALVTLQDIEESSDLTTGLYAVADSEYLRWFHFESEAIHKGQALAHYCLTTVDSVIDVISFDPPMVQSA